MKTISGIDLPFEIGLDDKERGGWELRTQHTLLEPQESDNEGGLEDFGGDGRPPGAPRGNLVISRQVVSEGDAEPKAQLREFLDQSAQAIPNLQILRGPETLHFVDGEQGDAVVIQFSATPGIDLIQLHCFRLDSDVVTQIVATVGENQGARLKLEAGDLYRLVCSFSPTPSEGHRAHQGDDAEGFGRTDR
jgi:hypothetical protein